MAYSEHCMKTIQVTILFMLGGASQTEPQVHFYDKGQKHGR